MSLVPSSRSPEMRRIVFLSGVGATGKTTIINKLREDPRVVEWTPGTQPASPGSIILFPSRTREYYKEIVGNVTEKEARQQEISRAVEIQNALFWSYVRDLQEVYSYFGIDAGDYPLLVVERAPYDHVSYCESMCKELSRVAGTEVVSSPEFLNDAEFRLSVANNLLSSTWGKKRNLDISVLYTTYPAPWSQSDGDKDVHAEDGFRDASTRKNTTWYEALLSCLFQATCKVQSLDASDTEKCVQTILETLSPEEGKEA